MISFSTADFLVICSFFAVILLIGFIAGRKQTGSEEYLLSGRKVGLFLFILTNVSTWYGGILGVGEFTYRYGLLSWFTQGLPYYIFAIIFALFFAGRIRKASLFTIPDKLNEVYGPGAAGVSAVLIFILVSPAPYLLMTANLFSLVFKIDMIWGLLAGIALSGIYLFQGGYKSDLYTDAFEFFIMFIGFIIIVIAAFMKLGDFTYLNDNLPAEHLSLSGGASPVYIIVWFLIALWTFTDPGFHQRCYAAKSSSIAVKGIIISVFFWALFDFLTTSTGLYARAAFPSIQQPVLSFPMLAEKLLGPGLKGLFYAALFATIFSTLNSFFFLSATTLGRDFLFRYKKDRDESNLKKYTGLGLIASAVISVLLSVFIPSVIDMWYTIGTICIPGLIMLVVGAYYPKLRISSRMAVAELSFATITSIAWYFIRPALPSGSIISEIEPMIIGLMTAVVIHTAGIMLKDKRNRNI